MLTTSGHYIVTIGYFNSQYTAFFNDPYGNKNSGYMNYNGHGVYYDWPGYNNGYSNLNTVTASSTRGPIVRCPGRPPTAPSPIPSTMVAGSTATVWAEFNNTGTGALAHGETYLGTQGPQDRSSPFCNLPNWSSCSRPTRRGPV